MIGQCLLNKNESATVSFFFKKMELNNAHSGWFHEPGETMSTHTRILQTRKDKICTFNFFIRGTQNSGGQASSVNRDG